MNKVKEYFYGVAATFVLLIIAGFIFTTAIFREPKVMNKYWEKLQGDMG